jgi:hypothetical protein
LFFGHAITLAVLKTLDMEANQTGTRQRMSSRFVLACCSRGKFTSSAEQNALSYVNCIIWDLSVCLSICKYTQYNYVTVRNNPQNSHIILPLLSVVMCKPSQNSPLKVIKGAANCYISKNCIMVVCIRVNLNGLKMFKCNFKSRFIRHGKHSAAPLTNISTSFY